MVTIKFIINKEIGNNNQWVDFSLHIGTEKVGSIPTK